VPVLLTATFDFLVRLPARQSAVPAMRCSPELCGARCRRGLPRDALDVHQVLRPDVIRVMLASPGRRSPASSPETGRRVADRAMHRGAIHDHAKTRARPLESCRWHRASAAGYSNFGGLRHTCSAIAESRRPLSSSERPCRVSRGRE